MINITDPINEVSGLGVPVPIFIPTAGIKPLPQPDVVEKQGGKISIEPIEGEQLQGFRCSTILDSAATYEQCGKREPMDWLGRVAVALRSDRSFNSLFAEYEKDFMDEMKPVPIRCLALYPSEEGYIVCGGWPTRFIFRTSSAWMDERAIIELSAYQPLPRLTYDGSVGVEECSEVELATKLKDLIG